LAIKEMQIKTTLKFHFTPVRLAIIKGKKKSTNAVEDAGKRNPYMFLVVM
jgi:hypothetical protein